jgi:hypothetical protein
MWRYSFSVEPDMSLARGVECDAPGRVFSKHREVPKTDEMMSRTPRAACELPSALSRTW